MTETDKLFCELVRVAIGNQVCLSRTPMALKKTMFDLNMTNKTIAVIMSLYKNDVVEYVRLSVESILNQTYRDLDLYLQYDGPIKPEVDAYLSGIKDERVHIQRRAENKGLAQSLNDLLAIVMPMGYDYIARMDADDISDLSRFEKQMEYMEAHKDVDCVGGAINEIDENGNDRGKITSYPLSPIDTFIFFKKRNALAHPTVMLRRRFFEKVGSFYPIDYGVNEDLMLWYLGFKNGAIIANVPDVILNFRMSNAMFTQRRNGNTLAMEQLRVRKIINKGLNYGFMADVYAYCTYLIMIAPTWLRKIAYRILR